MCGFINWLRLDETTTTSKAIAWLRGEEPRVNTVAILTNANPQGQPAGVRSNMVKLRDLKSDLLQMIRGEPKEPIVLRGSYGGREPSLLVANIKREDAIKIGRLHDQHSIIWGKKIMCHYGYPVMELEMIVCKNKQVDDVARVVLDDESVQARQDYYSQTTKNRKISFDATAGGKKFVIPFYDADKPEPGPTRETFDPPLSRQIRQEDEQDSEESTEEKEDK